MERVGIDDLAHRLTDSVFPHHWCLAEKVLLDSLH